MADATNGGAQGAWYITLGADTHQVGLMDFGQLGRALEVIDQAMKPLPEGLPAARRLIAIALEQDICTAEIKDGLAPEKVAELAYERVGPMRATVTQIVEAVGVIGIASGILRLGEPPKGTETAASA
ncbi:hypothetical protein [Nitrospirillum amazonense]|uniref:hypothetical protein n=1 Tax=Nitrospirillum amazonense TaxID=28077 RepID=UPI0024128AA2|nr:hypothetical protein [Nitrospirillum amazonense]MDG3442472.1 hypothetical protein [Nitrospirillum amazonense]